MLRMGHQADHITLGVGDARDVVQRAIRIDGVSRFTGFIDITKDDLSFIFEGLERGLVSHKTAFPMLDGNAQNFTNIAAGSKAGPRSLYPNPRPLTHERERTVTDKGTRQETRLT